MNMRCVPVGPLQANCYLDLGRRDGAPARSIPGGNPSACGHPERTGSDAWRPSWSPTVISITSRE